MVNPSIKTCFKPKKILVIKLKKLGDVLNTTPVTRQLKRIFPAAEITFLSEPLGAQVYKNSSHIDQLLVLNRKPSITEYFKLLAKINRSNFDLVIDLYDHYKTALLTLFSFANYRLGFAKEGKKSVSYNHIVSISLEERKFVNSTQHLLKLTHILGTDLNDNSIEFEISEETKKWGAKFCDDNLITSKTIAFCAQSERENAQVPIKLFVEIGNYLIQNGYLLYFVYGPGEKSSALAVYNLLDKNDDCLIDYEMPTIAQLKAVFENCGIYIGNDGGNKHIAITAKICTLGLFYGDNPKVWTPNEPKKHRYLQSKDNKAGFDEFVEIFEGWNFNKKEFIN